MAPQLKEGKILRLIEHNGEIGIVMTSGETETTVLLETGKTLSVKHDEIGETRSVRLSEERRGALEAAFKAYKRLLRKPSDESRIKDLNELVACLHRKNGNEMTRAEFVKAMRSKLSKWTRRGFKIIDAKGSNTLVLSFEKPIPKSASWQFCDWGYDHSAFIDETAKEWHDLMRTNFKEIYDVLDREFLKALAASGRIDCQEGIGVEGKLNAFYDVTVSVPLRETFSKEYAAALATLLNKGLKAKS